MLRQLGTTTACVTIAFYQSRRRLNRPVIELQPDAVNGIAY